MLHSINTLPTHLVVGVGKSGTSWIWKQMQEYEEISTSAIKEVHFFNKNLKKGIDWYKSQFKPNKIIVDNSPDYFSCGDASRIKNCLPNSKIMVCLRNPIERAFSQYKYHRFIKIINLNYKFIDVWKSNIFRIKTLSNYSKSLTEYNLLFRDHFTTVFYDDLKNDPDSFISSICNFLGVDKKKSKYDSTTWMPRINNDPDKLKEYNEINKNLHLSEVDRNLLIDFYRDDILRTSKITNRDLSSWLL